MSQADVPDITIREMASFVSSRFIGYFGNELIADCQLHSRLQSFYEFLRNITRFNLIEFFHSIYLIMLIIKEDSISSDESSKSSTLPQFHVVKTTNIGTILLISVMLSLKMYRDYPPRNSYFAKELLLPLEIINQSESSFLKKIQYKLHPLPNGLLGMIQDIILIGEPKKYSMEQAIRCPKDYTGFPYILHIPRSYELKNDCFDFGKFQQQERDTPSPEFKTKCASPKLD
ncbi:uncharacterized protein MONOS_18530 [Monocercomonoides exilis]|uniref:uncharacterized protein n=1 Tax=Monocercomonoides exilis TaxID=2049356 RepID=UPI00355A0B6B|nr:hypothetical protein MONOS_18530 [Monocercomonoides exilis]